MHNTRSVLETKNVDVTELVGGIEDEGAKEELKMCKHFPADSEVENGRQRVFIFAMDILDAHTLSQKLDTLLEKLEYAAKLNAAFGFVLKNVEDGTCWYYYAHENNTFMERSKLVATKEDLTEIMNVLSNTDVIETCTKERANTKWKLYKVTIVIDFAALLIKVPKGFKNEVLPEPLSKNHTVNCLTSGEITRKTFTHNLCLFRAPALHLHGNG